MDKENQHTTGSQSPGVIAMLEAEAQKAKAKELRAEAKRLTDKAQEDEAKATKLNAEELAANEKLRAPLVEHLQRDDKKLADALGKLKANKEALEDAQRPFIKKGESIQSALESFQWAAGRDLFALRATFPVYSRNLKPGWKETSSDYERIGWTQYIQQLCKTKLTMSPRSAHTYLKMYETWVGHEALGEAAVKAGLSKKSEIVLATAKDNPTVDPVEILRVAKQQITVAKTAASDALSLLRDQYTIGGQLDKVQKIERAEGGYGGYKVTVRVAADVIAKAVPAEANISVILNPEQLAQVPGGVFATVTMRNSDAVSSFLAACGVQKFVSKEEKAAVIKGKAAKEKGAAEGK
jgi:hypothetical protein